MFARTKRYIQEQIATQQEFERKRYWDLWYKCASLEAQHRKLLDYLGLEQKQMPETTIISKKEP